MCKAQINVGGVWKDVTRSQIKVGSVWKEVYMIQHNVGGTWEQSHTRGIVALQSSYTVNAITTGTAQAYLNWQNDGTVDRNINGTVTDPFHNFFPYGGTVGNFEWRITAWSGTVPSGWTVNTWYNCGVAKSMGFSQSTIGQTSGNGTFQIRDKDTLQIVDSCSISLSAEKITNQ